MQLWDKTKYKLAVPEWCLPGDGIFSLQMASSLGLDGVQLEAGFYETGFKLGHPWVQRLYREAAAQYGLELISIVMNDLDRHGLRHGRGPNLAISPTKDWILRWKQLPPWKSRF